MVESDIRRGSVVVRRMDYVKPTFKAEQKLIERTVIQRILSANREFNPEEFESLQLDGILTPDILPEDRNFLQNFYIVHTLTLNSCNLKSLVNFPLMKKLTRVELSNNKIQTGICHIAERTP